MPEIKLYYYPGTCSRAPMIGLEEAGVAYETELVAFMRGDNKSPGYLAINPKGKVPAMVADGAAITETSAMLLYLANAFPEAKLLPLGKGAAADAAVMADVVWCSSSVHPNVFHTRLPQFFCDEESGAARVREMAMVRLAADFQQIEDRLANGPWFCGEDWSVIDGYLSWAWFRVQGTGFDASPFPRFAEMYERVRQRPSVARTLAKEQEAYGWLEANGLMVNFKTLTPKSGQSGQ